MLVEIKPHMLKQHTRWGTVEIEHGLSWVLVDGKSAGYVPKDGKFAGIFHPLSGVTQPLCDAIVKNSNGKLKGTLRAPITEPRVQDILDGDDDE